MRKRSPRRIVRKQDPFVRAIIWDEYILPERRMRRDE